MAYVGDKLAPMFNPRPVQRALRRIAEEGGRHMTELTARNTPVRTGHLRHSWRTHPVIVVVDVATGRRGYQSGTYTEVEYARWVEEGTGLFGERRAKYAIEPRNPDGWLKWIDPHSGEPVFAKRVMHPGSPGNHMLAIAVAITEHELPALVEPILLEFRREVEANAR